MTFAKKLHTHFLCEKPGYTLYTLALPAFGTHKTWDESSVALKFTRSLCRVIAPVVPSGRRKRIKNNYFAEL